MKFNRDTLLKTDVRGVSDKERIDIANKFFPETKSDMQKQLEQVLDQMHDNAIWEKYVKEENSTFEKNPFKYSHEQLLYYGRKRTQHETSNTVTGFTKWIMSLYLPPPNKSQLHYGKVIERRIARFRRCLPPTRNEWKLVYRDLLNGRLPKLKMSSLTVNGEAIWGIPDLVYKNFNTKEIIIIERKASNKPIPSNGWPNIPAQLWAYSKIDQFANAEKIILIGEIWGNVESQLKKRMTLKWTNQDQEFQQKNSELFCIYGGKIDEGLLQ